MKPSYKLLPDIAIADVAFEARASDLNQLFETAAMATCDIMADLKSIKPKYPKEIILSADTLENLLYDFLSEIIFLKDVESLLFCQVSARVKKAKEYTVKATLKGDKINPATQKLGNDVKAVTLHMFSIKKEGETWKAHVVLDI